MQVTKTSDKLYKRDTSGNIRIWFYDVGTDGERWGYRTTAGVIDGKHVTSEWKFVEQKNVGRANETSLEEQALFEANADFTKKSEREYFNSIDDVDTIRHFKPMLAGDYSKHEVVFDSVIYSQPKLDGMRCIAKKDGLWSRAGKEIVAVPHISNALKKFFEENPKVVLDGELYNHDLKDNFNKIMSLCRKTKPTQDDFVEAASVVEYHVYDAYMTDDPKTPFANRIELVDNIVRDLNSQCIKCVTTMSVDSQDILDDIYAAYLEDGYEGQIVRFNTAYENKRTKKLLKRKDFADEEFPVIRVEEGKGNWAGYVKRFVVDVNGEEVGCGVRGNQETLKALLTAETPKWAKVQYFGKTPDGSLRFPVVLDWGMGTRQD
jgi:DNA ligase-1